MSARMRWLGSGMVPAMAFGLFQSAWLLWRYQDLMKGNPVLRALLAGGFVAGVLTVLVVSPLALGLSLLAPRRREDPDGTFGAALLGLAVALAVLTFSDRLLAGPLLGGSALGVAGGVLALLAGLLAAGLPRPPARARPWLGGVGVIATLGVVGFAGATMPRPPAPPAAAQVPAGRGPDILLVSVDTLRADRLGPWGGTLTPKLDALAAEGTVYTRASSAAPWTLPSVASILTGRAALDHRAGMPLDPTNISLRRPLPEGAVTLAERLRDAGYDTHGIVSNMFVDASFGLAQGFDGYENPVADASRAGILLENVLSRQLLRRADPRRFGDARAEALVDRALAWWRAPHDRPRFLWLHLIDPHAPYRADPRSVQISSVADEFASQATVLGDGTVVGERFNDVHAVREGTLRLQPADRARIIRYYDGAVAYADGELGRLFDAVRQDQNTILTFTADHGEELWDHGHLEHGHDYHSEITRVPLIFWGPGRIPAGQRIADPVGQVDLAPTLLALAGAQPLPETEDGGRALTLAPGQELPPRFCESNLYDLPAVLIEQGPWRYILRANGASELYDAEDDPTERDDRASREPEVTARFHALAAPRLSQTDVVGTDDAGLSIEAAEALKALGYRQ